MSLLSTIRKNEAPFIGLMGVFGIGCQTQLELNRLQSERLVCGKMKVNNASTEKEKHEI